MTLKVYGRKSSCNVQKVTWLCSELNIDYETLDYGGRFGGTKDEHFKSLNPNSTVPLIDDDVFRFNARGIITAAIANIILLIIQKIQLL